MSSEEVLKKVRSFAKAVAYGADMGSLYWGPATTLEFLGQFGFAFSRSGDNKIVGIAWLRRGDAYDVWNIELDDSYVHESVVPRGPSGVPRKLIEVATS